MLSLVAERGMGGWRKHWSVWLITLAVASACTADSAPEAPPEIGTVRQITDLSQVAFPLEAYEMTAEEDIVLQRAVWQLAIECLNRFGADITPPPLVATNELLTSRRYGLLDLESAGAWGYHGGDPAVDRANVEADGPAAAERLGGLTGGLLFGEGVDGVSLPPGAPRDGCLNEARRILAEGGEMYDPNFLFSRANEALIRAERDERVEAAFTAWSACMADAGFSYAGPWDANNDSQWREDIVTDQERLVATADVTCKLETNLIGIWNAVDAAYQERIIERDAELLAEMVEDRRQLIDRAAEIVENSR